MIGILLPGTLGDGTTTGTGTPPSVDWSVAGVGSRSAAGCAVHAEVDAWGTVTGSIHCADQRLAPGKRVRVTIEFRAVPAVSGPLPVPAPTMTPSPTPDLDPVCGLLDAAIVSAATDAAGLILLPAGPGQCIGLSPDVEVAALVVLEGPVDAPLGDGTAWRGASCAPLTADDPALLPVAGDCTWPDGRRLAVAAAHDPGESPATLVLSLAVPGAPAGAPVPPETLEALASLLATAAERHP